MDSSVSPTHGEQQMSVWNGHYACTCYHPLFLFILYRVNVPHCGKCGCASLGGEARNLGAKGGT